MSRIARSYLVGKIFHITVKGINGEYIFQGNENKKKYLNLLKKDLEGTNLKILAYCIMDNHAHILIATEKIEEMSTYMKKVNTAFANFYNKINERQGYVFKNRFFSQPIEDRKHLFSCIVYIHKNPVKALIVKGMQDYKFSSYREYFGQVNNYLIEKEMIYKFFDNKNISEYMVKFKEFHLRDSLLEYEFDEEINYKELIKAYKKYFSDKEIVKILIERFKLNKQKIAILFNTTKYNINKMIK